MGRYKKTVIVEEKHCKKSSFSASAKPILLTIALGISSFAGVMAIAVDPNLPRNMAEFPDRIGAYLDGKEYVSRAQRQARARKLAKLQFKTMLKLSLQGMGEELPYAYQILQMSDDYADACFDGFYAGEYDVFGSQIPENFEKMGKDLVANFADYPGLISGCSYLIGVHLGIAGVLKIKDHVENPINTPLRDGAIRLSAGGSLFALPIVTEAMLNSIGDSGGVTVAKLEKVELNLN